MPITDVYTQEDVDAISEPKYVWEDMGVYHVYTEEDIPSSNMLYKTWDGTSWVINDMLLTEAKNTVTQSMQQHRDNLCFTTGVNVGGHWWFIDPNDRTRYLATIMSYSLSSQLGLPAPIPVEWHTMSGEYVPLTFQLAVGIMQATAINEANIFAVYKTHLDNLLTSEDPLNYDYSTGWPVGYTG